MESFQFATKLLSQQKEVRGGNDTDTPIVSVDDGERGNSVLHQQLQRFVNGITRIDSHHVDGHHITNTLGINVFSSHKGEAVQEDEIRGGSGSLPMKTQKASPTIKNPDRENFDRENFDRENPDHENPAL